MLKSNTVDTNISTTGVLLVNLENVEPTKLIHAVEITANIISINFFQTGPRNIKDSVYTVFLCVVIVKTLGKDIFSWQICNYCVLL